MRVPQLSEAVPAGQTIEGEFPIRYEDVVQDGRFRARGVPPLLGPTVWGGLLSGHPLEARWRESGIVPILTRVVVRAGGGPINVIQPVRVRAGWELAHVPEGDRIRLTMRCDVTAPKGHIHFPPPDAGTVVHLGSGFSESTMTRPFAPPGQRRVTTLEPLGVPPHPGPARPLSPADQLLQPPEGAVLLGQPLVRDVHFGLDHTDSNQHVNSLAYPTLFGGIALDAFAAADLSTAVLVTGVDVRWRKPCFAGDRVVARVHPFRLGPQLGVVASLAPADADRPHCTAHLLFDY